MNFIIKDLNGDKIPEFILIDTDFNYAECFYQEIYTYFNNKVTPLEMSNCAYSYYKGTNIINSSGGSMGYDYITYYRLMNGKQVELASYTDNIPSGERKIKKYYYMGNKKVSKTKFNNYIKKITKSKKPIDIESNYKSFLLTKDNINNHC